jgi:hypothetical protein
MDAHNELVSTPSLEWAHSGSHQLLRGVDLAKLCVAARTEAVDAGGLDAVPTERFHVAPLLPHQALHGRAPEPRRHHRPHFGAGSQRDHPLLRPRRCHQTTATPLQVAAHHVDDRVLPRRLQATTSQPINVGQYFTISGNVACTVHVSNTDYVPINTWCFFPGGSFSSATTGFAASISYYLFCPNGKWEIPETSKYSPYFFCSPRSA